MSATLQPYKLIERELALYFDLLPAGDGGCTGVPSVLAWAREHRRIDDKPFSLDDHKPLRAIYEDEHPDIVVMKPAQVGVSEYAITRACHTLDVGHRYWQTGKSGLNVGYLFPTEAALSSFSKERFTGLRVESPHLAKLFTDYDDVGFKQAGESYLYLRGGRSTNALKSFAADELIYDEYDEMSPVMIALADKRMRASRVRRKLRLSTPTLPGKGIHAEYLLSDRRVWEIECGACGEWVELDFFRDARADGVAWEGFKTQSKEELHRARMTIECPCCKQIIPDERRFGEGRWTARAPEIMSVRGYHVPALAFPSVSLNEVAINLTSLDPTQVTEGYRQDLGLPYEPKGARLTDEMLTGLSVELEGGVLPATTWRQTTIGIDVGSRFHFRISSTGTDGKRYVRLMGSVGSYAELDELIVRMKIRHGVIDALPEVNSCAQWAAKHKGKILRAFYAKANALKTRMYRTAAERETEGDVSEQQDAHTVQINRTMAMDHVFAVIAAGEEVWSAQTHNDPEVRGHMKAPLRVVSQNAEGDEVASWVHTAPDHLFHACVYDQIAFLTLPKELPGTLALGSAKGWGIGKS